VKSAFQISYDQFGFCNLEGADLLAVTGGDITVFYDGRNLGDSNFCPGYTADAPVSARVNINCHERTYDNHTTPDGTNVRCRPNAGGLNPVCYNNLGCG